MRAVTSSISTLLLILVMIAGMGMVTASAQQKTTDDEEKLKVHAVMMYADWCSKCKVLDPKAKKVKKAFKDQGVLFTKFDMTNDFTKSQTDLLAEQLGLSPLYEKHKGRTGYMVLLEAQTHKVLSTINHKQSKQSIRKEIQKALAKAGN